MMAQSDGDSSLSDAPSSHVTSSSHVTPFTLATHSTTSSGPASARHTQKFADRRPIVPPKKARARAQPPQTQPSQIPTPPPVIPVTIEQVMKEGEIIESANEDDEDESD